MTVAQPSTDVEPDFSWINIAVTATDTFIIDASAGFDVYIEGPYWEDNFEIPPPQLPKGIYRWSGFAVGSWGEDEHINITGGSFRDLITPHFPDDDAKRVVNRLREYRPYRLPGKEWFGPAFCSEAADLLEASLKRLEQVEALIAAHGEVLLQATTGNPADQKIVEAAITATKAHSTASHVEGQSLPS